jgi:hypothetical protein
MCIEGTGMVYMDNYVIGGRWWGTSLCLVGWQSIFFDLEHLDSAKKNDRGLGPRRTGAGLIWSGPGLDLT